MRRGFALGFVWGLGFFLPLLSWSLNSVGQWPPWMALSAFQALFIGLFGAGVARVESRYPRAGVVPAIVLWVAIEQLRSVVPFGGFPWGNLAFSQTDGPLLSLAPVGGTVLVSGVVVLAAAALARLARLKPSGILSLAIAAALTIGGTLLPAPTVSEDDPSLRVGVVQGNVPVRGAEALGQARAITHNYRLIVEREAPWEVDLMVWPESAADIDPRTDPDVAVDVAAAQEAADVPILLGTQRYVDDMRFNEYILWDADGPQAAYTKQHPVPFGEYMPFRDFFRMFSSAVDRVSVDMAAGTEPAVMTVPLASGTVDLSTAICFEVAYDSLMRESVQLGAQALIVPTNNASFGFSQEASQQLAITRFRAAEHARAAIQVSTVGISGVFDVDGTVLARSGELYTEWTTIADLPLNGSITPSTWMDQGPRIVVWALAGIWMLATLRRKRER